ncbi:MAG: response regulator [Candidatus Marinimicrobia bacterium]|nr:response regulator [Candidatus Neomarinimicrobiota bacterium]MCF7850379.1 response regulator [Candidatus Neomarinimicrobiota bacterium]MCF7904981.1 response regulator [Candidatus Neomarinimicrobiota bacterium]
MNLPAKHKGEIKGLVLVIDDNEEVLEFMVEALSENGYECLRSQDGEKGLQLLQETDVDLVITDIYLPQINGLDLIQKMREFKPEIKILAISGDFKQHKHDSLKWAKSLGAVDSLEKPFSYSELIAKVAKLSSA